MASYLQICEEYKLERIRTGSASASNMHFILGILLESSDIGLTHCCFTVAKREEEHKPSTLSGCLVCALIPSRSFGCGSKIVPPKPRVVGSNKSTKDDKTNPLRSGSSILSHTH